MAEVQLKKGILFLFLTLKHSPFTSSYKPTKILGLVTFLLQVFLFETLKNMK